MTTLSRAARVTGLVGLCALVLGGCVSRRLAERPVEGEPIRLVVRIAADARVNASYSVRLDPDDPVGSLVSIGTTFAKADQAMRAEQRMNAALRMIDLEALIGDGIADFFAIELDMPVVPPARDATSAVSRWSSSTVRASVTS